MIHNPRFETQGIDAVVVPMGARPDDHAAFLRQRLRLTNIRGEAATAKLEY